MASKGRGHIKPVEESIREGNPSKRPLPEPMLVSGRPDPDELLEPPESLPKDGKDAWRMVVPQLAEVGVLDRIDVLNLTAMCTAWARAQQAGKVIARQGHIVRGAGGQLREHPSLRTEREAYRQFLTFSQEFALTPVARTRLGLAELHRRTLGAELESALGPPDLQPVTDAEAFEEDA